MTATYTDRFGMPVTTRSIRALEAYDEGMERALSFGVAPELSFERAVAEDPDFALAHAALAMTRLREMRVVEA
ncbi:MAG: hypothetical protein ACR2PL_09595, partial [Dehalococcoidia bacterium]